MGRIVVLRGEFFFGGGGTLVGEMVANGVPRTDEKSKNLFEEAGLKIVRTGDPKGVSSDGVCRAAPCQDVWAETKDEK